MATTTYQLVGNPSNIFPFTVPNGTVTAFNTATGQGTFLPNTGFTGVTAFTYYLLCDGVQCGTATVTITVKQKNCKKSVKVDICCGNKPFSFKVKETLTNEDVYISHVSDYNRFCIYYGVPDDNQVHNFNIEVYDSSNNLIGTRPIIQKRCKCLTIKLN